MSDSSIIPDDPFGPIKQPARSDNSPAARTVNQLHTNSDVDSFAGAQHHTLGVKHDQAAPGDHKHDGTNSVKLLDGIHLTGVKSGGTALENLIQLLVDKFGLTDDTT